jgi:hypothetical protein
MGAFNGLYLARREGEKSIQLVAGSSRGITTLPLEQKEGRETLLPTNERIYTDHIMWRTLETQRGAHVAFATYGGIGTEQEKLYFPGVMVLIDGNNFSNRRVEQLRISVALKTIILDPEAPDYDRQLDKILQDAPMLNPKNGEEFEQRYTELVSSLGAIQDGSSVEFGGGKVIEPGEIIGTPETRQQLERLFGPNWAAGRPPDPAPRALQDSIRPPPNGSANRIDLPTHTGHGANPDIRLPQTTAHDREANSYEPITVLTQALSLLKKSNNVSELVQQWSKRASTPLLRALLTQTGLTQVLQYGLGGRLLTALSHEGLSRYLSTYRTAQVLNTISHTHPGLATQAGALRTQVLGVLAARHQALKPTLSTAAQRAPASSVPILLNLQQAVQRLERAVMPAQRVQALKLLQGLVHTHLAGLQAVLTAGAAVSGTQQPLRQETVKMALSQLQQMQAWLSDPQRLQDVSEGSQAAWQTTTQVIKVLAGVLLLLPVEALKTLSPVRA